MKLAAERRAIAKQVGLEGDAWNFTVILEPSSKKPKMHLPKEATRFELRASASSLWILVRHEERAFSHLLSPKGEIFMIRTLALTPTKSMRNVRAWLRGVEKQLGLVFRRDRAYARANVIGGKEAVLAWIAE